MKKWIIISLVILILLVTSYLQEVVGFKINQIKEDNISPPIKCPYECCSDKECDDKDSTTLDQCIQSPPKLPYCVNTYLPSLCKSFFYDQCLAVFKLFGQLNYTETSRDTVVLNKIFHAAGIVVDTSIRPNKVYVADTGNSRILAYKSIGNCPLSQTPCTIDSDCLQEKCQIDTDKEADLIIGQLSPNFGACNGDNNFGMNIGPTAETLCLMPYPGNTNIAENWGKLNFDVDYKGNLYFPDYYNNRILIYYQPLNEQTGTAHAGRVADFVIGQENFYSNQPNKGQGLNIRDETSIYISGSGGASRGGVSVDDEDNVWVADTYNGRVLKFSSGSKVSDLVLGQDDFTSKNNAQCNQDYYTSNKYFCRPTLAKINPNTGQLYVIDEFKDPFIARILVFNPPFTNGMSASKIIVANQVGGFNNWDGNWPGDWSGTYIFQATGFEFNPYKTGEYSQGVIWVTEHQTNRALLLDNDGNIIKTINAPHTNFGGCDFNYYSQCEQSLSNSFHLCSPSGSIAFDSDNNMYIADEFFHRIARFALPYDVDLRLCLPSPNGGLMKGTAPNSVGPAKFTESSGLVVYGNQLIKKDESRYLIWEDYSLGFNSGEADIIYGQPSGYVRNDHPFLDARGTLAHAVDNQGRLWGINEHGWIYVYSLPFTDSTQVLANHVPLYWIDDNSQVNYMAHGGGLAFDKKTDKLWVIDVRNNRLLRIQDYNNINHLVVDMVIGQTDKEYTLCNHDENAGWTARYPIPNGLCVPAFAEFDNYGNLYVVENSYECHGNNRITMFTALDIAAANGTLFPDLYAKKVFIRDSFTDPNSPTSICYATAESPNSPISLAFNSKNQMVVGNDGYYSGPIEQRHLRQLWVYNNPLAVDSNDIYIQGQLPDAYLQVPMGSAGEIQFDNRDNLVIEDHTWQRVWFINFEQDTYWLVPL